MSNVFPRHCHAQLPIIANGDGVYLIDTNGNRYLDGCSGAAVSCLGHSNTAIATAVKDQTTAIAWAHTSFFTSAPAEELATMLAAAAPGDINRVYFVCGGSEAIEAAVKLARQYFVECEQPQRQHIIARQQSYHGNTLGALSIGGNIWRRAAFAPLLLTNTHHIEPCHYWRWGQENESPEEYGLRMANQLEEKIKELGEESVAAFVAEPVVGATMGAVAATAGYFARIREICSQYGVLLILDEVMCGMGRTGTLFAYEQENITPDIVCIGKGIGGGVQPLAAMLCTEKIYATIANNSGFFQHGHTYLGHPTACAAGVAVLQEIEKHHLLARTNDMGQRLKESLIERLGEHPHIGDIRGRGLFLGMEFVTEGKTPFAPQKKIHAAIKKAAFARGLMVYGMGGTIDGDSGDHILIAPPFIIEESHIDELVDKLADTVHDVLG
ncbi:MAG: aspartate aminotransferase family protein [Gammaproteobacteria bacterium WSBS_2016_MAG_OTU1]